MWSVLKILRQSLGSWTGVISVIARYSYSMAFYYGWKIYDYMGYKRPVVMSFGKSVGRVDYIVDGSSYSIMFPYARGPYKFSHVTDETGVDATDDIKAIMGPGKNFYGIQSTPGMLGYDTLIFHDYCGGMKYFSTDSIIEV